MITCFHCKGESQVVLSRKQSLDGTNQTMARTRQCKKCRWKWKTIEIQIPVDQPSIKVPVNACL